MFIMTKCPGHAILGKKVPRNPKQRTLFPVTFFQGFDKIQTFSKFLFPGFFPQKLFSSGLSYTDSMVKTTKCSRL